MWVFRGRKAADRAIQVATNSPVSHVGMSVVIGDLPPLTWHWRSGPNAGQARGPLAGMPLAPAP
jgi:hypothetical protein